MENVISERLKVHANAELWELGDQKKSLRKGAETFAATA